MSNKRECPACTSYTSAIYRAFMDGLPCPYCGLPSKAADMIDNARDRKVADEVVKRLTELESEMAEMRKENGELKHRLRGVRQALESEAPDMSWTDGMG